MSKLRPWDRPSLLKHVVQDIPERTIAETVAGIARVIKLDIEFEFGRILQTAGSTWEDLCAELREKLWLLTASEPWYEEYMSKE